MQKETKKTPTEIFLTFRDPKTKINYKKKISSGAEKKIKDLLEKINNISLEKIQEADRIYPTLQTEYFERIYVKEYLEECPGATIIINEDNDKKIEGYDKNICASSDFFNLWISCFANTNGAHSIVAFVDRNNKIIEIYDSNYSENINIDNYSMGYCWTKANQYLQSQYPDFRIYEPSDFCEIGSQNYLNSTPISKTKGYCMMYSALYMLLRSIFYGYLSPNEVSSYSANLTIKDKFFIQKFTSVVYQWYMKTHAWYAFSAEINRNNLYWQHILLVSPPEHVDIKPKSINEIWDTRMQESIASLKKESENLETILVSLLDKISLKFKEDTIKKLEYENKQLMENKGFNKKIRVGGTLEYIFETNV